LTEAGLHELWQASSRAGIPPAMMSCPLPTSESRSASAGDHWEDIMISKFILALALSAAATTAFAADPYDALPSAGTLPKDAVQESPIVPLMGEHWAKKDEWPLGPIYCVYKGKIVCLEFMISQEDFVAGKSWPVLAGMPGLPPVNHVNVGFVPNGHPGYEIPHYDIHMYFVSPEEVAKIQP
jgi:hypothetical protein